MFRKIFLSTCFVLVGFVVAAQNQDSLLLTKSKWHKQRIAPEVKLYQYHFKNKKLFSANENISYVEVKNRRRSYFSVAAEEKILLTTSTFAERENATAAINGNFFDVKKGGSVDFVQVNGKVINENRMDKNGERARHQQAGLAITNGKLKIHKWDGSEDWEKKLSTEDVLLNGPLLLWNGVAETLDTAGFNRLRHPRTCVGIKPNGNIILLTVDGRNEESAGMSLFELEKTMRWLGCTTALNFDGGGSTTLWIKDFPNQGVVNYPTDNKKWDHDGQRKVANVLLVKQK